MSNATAQTRDPAAKGAIEVAVFDLDNTLTTQSTFTPFCIWLLARRPQRLWRAGPATIGFFQERAKQISRKVAKERAMRAIMGGLTREALNAYAEAFIGGWVPHRIRPGAMQEIERQRAAGRRLVIASAAMEECAVALARHLGFDHVIATHTAYDADGRATGRLDGENCYDAEKMRRVRLYLDEIGGALAAAFSDHQTDLDLLVAADRGVAVCPNRRLRAAALERNMEIAQW